MSLREAVLEQRGQASIVLEETTLFGTLLLSALLGAAGGFPLFSLGSCSTLGLVDELGCKVINLRGGSQIRR